MRSAVVLAICAVPAVAGADPPTSPIVDSNYSIELYDGVAYGNAAVVGMGGAAVGLAIGTAGTLFNPSAPAVKPTTDTDYWSWDYHLDGVAGSSRDYDNNGFETNYTDNVVGTAGLGGRYGEWGGAVTVTSQTIPINGTLSAKATRLQIAGARWIDRLDTALGAAVTFGILDLTETMPDGSANELFSVSGGSLEAGATWIPRARSLRVGAAASAPMRGGDVKDCPPDECVGWTLPESIVSATRVAGGFAYRFAGTEWNQLVGGHFRDERSLTLATDVVVTGSTENAFGLEAFATQKRLQRSGSHTAISLRGGLEWEWLPGRLRVRGGSYWEPGRFDGVSGRLHGTFGFELRVFQFHLWGKPRRGRITATFDGATRYANGGISIGFWH